MVNFVNHFRFRLQVTTDQVCTFTEEQLRIRLFRLLRKILRQVQPRPVSPKIPAVCKGPNRRVNYEAIRSGHAVVHMNWLHLYPSHFQPVTSSERLELDTLKIVLEAPRTRCRKGLQNHLSRL